MALRVPTRRTALALLAVFPAALWLHSGSTPNASAATAAVLEFPTATCGPSTSVSFAWQPADAASEVWLDVSTEDNGFAAGTFQGSGPFGVGTSSFTLTSLKAETAYLARVNSRTPSGWLPSETVAFVPCGAPQLLSYTPSCAGEGAAASFRWAPSAPAASQQQIDAGTDQGFSPGNTRSSGPLLAAANRFEMSGLRADVTNYLRITAVMADGSQRRSKVVSFTAVCSGIAGGVDELIHTGDTLVYPRLNINAPVNVRRVGADGSLGLPEGKDDVVLYDLSVYKMGGSPGRGGTSILAGHLDYRPNFRGVFWDLAKAREGDIIDYYREDGSRFSYQVTWAALLPSEEPMNQYFGRTDPETMILITCEGNWDAAARNYDKRALVYAVAITSNR